MFSVTDVKGMSPLDIALQGLYDVDPEFDVAVYLVRRGCGSDENKAKLLCAACYNGKLDVVKELVEQHKVDPKGELSLINVCSYLQTASGLSVVHPRVHTVKCQSVLIFVLILPYLLD